MATFEVLPGLPPYGAVPEAFSETGHGRGREGYVARFEPIDGPAWVGNFQPGLASLHLVCDHPNGREVLAIASGQGYVVDPLDRTKREYFGGQIADCIPVPELALLVFGNGLWFEAIGSSGRAWRSERLSWDGMRSVVRAGLHLHGEAWHPDDLWMPFTLDLTSGAHSGGSYPGPLYGSSPVPLR